MVAHDWGKTPTEFWESSAEAQAMMIAYTVANAQMSDWEDQNRPKPDQTPPKSADNKSRRRT